MERIAYLDCPAGIAGDMALAAMIHAGADLAAVRDAVTRVLGHPVPMDVYPASGSGIHGLRLRVLHDHAHDHAHAHDHPHPHAHAHDHAPHHDHPEDRSARTILAAIAAAGLPAPVAQRAAAVFQRLAVAEARVHGVDPQDVHFHEVGAVDSIADIVGVAAALHDLGIDRVEASPLPMTHGYVRTQHGRMPIPAPATLEVLAGYPVFGADVAGEFVTPTGAALCATLASATGPMPAMRPVAIGFGFGTREWPDGRPNCVRVVLGEAVPTTRRTETDEWEIAANLDDCTPETVSVLCDALFAAGALDAWTTPILMKKGRPAWTVSAVAAGDRRDDVIRAFFAESTTIGLRMHRLDRVRATFHIAPVQTELGSVRVKIARFEDRVVQRSLESDDVRRLARDAGIAVREARRILERTVAQADLPDPEDSGFGTPD